MSMLDNQLHFRICYHHAQAGGDISEVTADYHNDVDDSINSQMDSLGILHRKNAEPKIFKSFRDQIVTLANSANNRISLVAMGLSPTSHNQKIFDRANKFLPEGEKI